MEVYIIIHDFLRGVNDEIINSAGNEYESQGVENGIERHEIRNLLCSRMQDLHDVDFVMILNTCTPLKYTATNRENVKNTLEEIYETEITLDSFYTWCARNVILSSSLWDIKFENTYPVSDFVDPTN